MMLQSRSFYSLTQGPRFLVLGAVHGDEKCGTVAIERMIKEIDEGRIILKQGSVTCVPICNPKAYEANVRFIDRNLNRFLIPHTHPKAYEAYVGNRLCPLLETCDYLLDLHSYHAGQGSFVYVGKPGSDEHAFANSLGASAGLTGWAQAYAASGVEKTQSDPDESTGTTEYARRFGAIAATMECGQHNDPHSSEAGFKAICGALAYLKMIESPPTQDARVQTRLVTLKKVFYRTTGGHFTKDWQELDEVHENDVIAFRENGEQLVAPGDGYIILPNAHARPDAEWFYWGQ